MDKLPVDARYFITVVSTMLASFLYQQGWIGDQASFISNATALGVAAIPVATWLYARWVRPSAPALEVAKQADQIMSGEKPAGGVVETPVGTPNIIVKPELGAS
jgi:hypothetical protein